MEPKEPIDHHVATATFSFDKKEIRPVGELDPIALVKLCASDRNDSAAWHEFLSRFIGRIRLFVFRASQSQSIRNSAGSCGGVRVNPADREDLVQEVLLRLVAHDCRLLRRFDGDTDAAWSRYLSIITISVVVDRYRYLHRQRRPERQSSLEQVDPTVLERIGLCRDDLKMEKAILVQEIVQSLEELLREEIPEVEVRNRYLLIFHLYLFDGLSLSQIGRYYGINLSKQGVDKILTSIMGRLRDKLRAPREQR